MPTLELVLTALLGLAFGSFLNVCVSRLPEHRSIVRPGSRCPRCGAPVRPRDNVPVLSFLLLGGRCRRCRARIGWRYPLLEAAAGAAAVGCVFRFGAGLEGVSLALFCCLLLALAATDWETRTLPDALTLPLLCLGVIVRAAQAWANALPASGAWRAGLAAGSAAAGAALAAAGLLWAVGWIYERLRGRRGMGMGDVKLAAAIAAWLGPGRMLLVLFLAVGMGAMGGSVLALTRRRRSSGSRSAASGSAASRSSSSQLPPASSAEPLALPFGSLLCAAAIYGAFAGDATLRWYLSFFPR